MARFNAKPLQVLDGIYRFVGGLRGSSRIDIESPITLVHDVSREAERAAGFFALNKSQSLVVALSTTDYVALTRADILAGVDTRLDELGLEPETTDVWWVRSWLLVDDTDDNFESAGLGLVQGGAQFVNDDGQIIFAYGGIGNRITPASLRQLYRVSNSTVVPPEYIQGSKSLPLFMEPGANTAVWLRLTSSAGGGCQVQAQHVFWFGPEGATPPPYRA